MREKWITTRRPKKCTLLHILVCYCCTGIFSSFAQAGQLYQLYLKTIETNPSLLSRGYTIEQMRARENQAFSALLPQISVDGSYTYNRFDSDLQNDNYYPSVRASAVIRQSLVDLPAYYRYLGAEAETLQAEIEKHDYLIRLSADLIDRYLLVLQASDQIRYLQEEQTSVIAQIKRLQKMRERQMVTVMDVYEMEAYGHDLNTQVIEAKNEQSIALERIREMSSILPEQLSLLKLSSIPPPPTDVSGWIDQAINSNPTLSAMRTGLVAAGRIISASRTGYYPRLSMQLSHTYSDQGFDNRQSPAFNVSSASVQMNIPLYSGGRVGAEIDEAVATRSLLQQDYERARREIERETRSTFLNAVSGHARIESTARQLEAQEKSVKAMQKAYDLGVSTIVNLLEAKRNLIRTKTDYWQARYQYLRNLTLLSVWAGSLNEEYVKKIDQWFVK